ncbi:NAD(P)-dependent oxidoreductase [Schleiferia thermophila]|uniref:D-3-phosphoglycerate dehydrogenase n=1 Tax=Schleiferia thermophila TaxID=884107 RepID=A0A369A6F1_9FLAO|nr:NAD(P)-dependent oxidoreductase [Schleiferia thermophila]RCX04930.1 D-3-phosphoglycerate dehydrogenase [Schleiferia thermophila]GCD79547.1 2-hydroxyacid dehydrogenase [Schleiferia thermophila]
MNTIALLDSVHPQFLQICKLHQTEVLDFTKVQPDQLPSYLRGVHAIVIRSRFLIDKTFIDLLPPTVKVIGRYGSGMENIDVAYAQSKGISCVHAPEGNRQAVAEHALGMLLTLFNHICRADAQVKCGIWQRESNRGEELAGKTIGIIGYGNTGSAFARLLAAFPDTEILVYDKYKSGFSHQNIIESTPTELQHRADILSLHIPLTPETHHLINSHWIAAHHKPFYLINTSRGPCVRTPDLVSALTQGKILGACLDVLEHEKTSFEGLQSDQHLDYLYQHPRVLITPHIAGWSHQSHIKLAEILARRILSHLT